MRKAVVFVSIAGVFASVSLAAPREAHAQTQTTAVAPTGKGIAGCALLGAETVMLIEAAAGARPGWAYIVGGILGGGAGGVGGYFLEQAASGSTTLTGLSVGSLVLGLGLVIPTTIATIGATAYNPEHDQPAEDNTQANGPLDEGTGNGPAATPSAPAPAPAPGGGATSGSTSDAAPVVRHHERSVAAREVRPTGLLDVTGSGLSLAVPAITSAPSYTAQEVRQYGVTPVSELRVPLLSGSF